MPSIFRAAWILLLLILLPPALLAQSWTRPAPGAVTYNPSLRIGPVPGLTTTWHRAPTEAGVPLGATIQFEIEALGDEVTWQGAREVERRGSTSIAETVFNVARHHLVMADISNDSGGRQERISITVIDTAVTPLVLSDPRLSVEPLSLGPLPANSSTMRYFFGSSIAQLTQVDERRYRTSTDRWMRLEVDVEPQAFAPLVEWRLDGEPQRHLGSSLDLLVFPARLHRIAAGGPGVADELRLETYRVRIASHTTGRDEIPEATPVTFTAVTDPPGHEDEITWLASTKFGSSSPVEGRGPSFTAWFRETLDAASRQWLGVRADNATFEQDRKDQDEDSGLLIDPDWGFDPETEFPPGPPSGSPTVVERCEPGIRPVVGSVDANGDGFDDVVALEANPGSGSCVEDVEFCLDMNGRFLPVTTGPFLHPSIAVPLAAVTNGCEGAPTAIACPLLSDGNQAAFCEGIAADPDCLTVTICPDEGWGDPADPSARRVLEVTDQETPAPDLEVPEEERLQAAESLLINPCRWDKTVDRSLDVLLVNPEGLAAGEGCAMDDECRSLDCGDDVCQAGLTSEVHQGTDQWNVWMKAGIEEGSLRARRIFYPSQEFDVLVKAGIDLRLTLFGHERRVLEVLADNSLSACDYRVSYDTRIHGQSVDLEGRIGDSGQFIEASLGGFEQQTEPDSLSLDCRQALAALQDAEKAANEAFHDALIAAAFYNFSGPTAISRSEAQGWLEDYESAAMRYEEELSKLQAAQRLATDHAISREIADLDVQFHLPNAVVVPVFAIGPFSLAFEANIVGKVGLVAEIENSAEHDAPLESCVMTCQQDDDCSESACSEEGLCEVPASVDSCFQVVVESTIKPRAAIGASLAFSAGIDLGIAGAQAGLRGELEFADFQLPVVAEVGLTRSTRPLDPSSLDLGDQEPGIANLLDGETGDIELLVEPSVAELNVPWAYGANLDGAFLNGQLEAFAKAWFLFFKAEWEKTIFRWSGIRKRQLWSVGDRGDSGLLSEFRDASSLGGAPNMVPLPKLNLDSPLALPQQDVENLLIEVLGEGHELLFLGTPWVPPTGGMGSTRCGNFTGRKGDRHEP